MLPEIGATELMVIAAVALIVVGPKDLPVLLRRVGQFMAKLRGMAADFRSSFDEMARQSELDELRREVEAMRRGQILDSGETAALEATNAEVHQTFNEIGGALAGRNEYAEDAYLPPAETPAAEPEPAVVAAPVKKPRKPRASKAAGTAAPAEAPAQARKPRARKPKDVA